MPNEFDTIYDQRQKTDETIKQNQNAVVSLSTSLSRQPLWVSPYPVSDVSFPIYSMARRGIMGTSGPASTGTAHTHSFDGNGNAYTAPLNYGTVANDANGCYITATSTFTADKAAMWMVYSPTPTSGTVQMQIFRENEDLSLTQIVDVNITAQITTTAGLVYVTIPPTVVQQGKRYVLRVANKSNQTIYHNSLLWNSDYSGHRTIGSTSTNKTSYTASEANTALQDSTLLLWGMLAQTVFEAEDKIYTDDFNRDNIGNSWYVYDPALGASTGAKLVLSNNRLSYPGPVSTYGQMYYLNPTNTDAQRMDLDIYGLVGNVSYVTMGITRATNGATMAVLVVDSTQARIRSYASSTYTTRATVTMPVADGKWSFYYDPTTNTYTALYNDADIGLSWIDSGNVVPHTGSERNCTIFINKDASGNTATADNWVFRDWTP